MTTTKSAIVNAPDAGAPKQTGLEEDLVVAVAAARATWAMAGIGRTDYEISSGQDAGDLRWIPSAGTALTVRPCEAAGNRTLSVN